jgi:type IV secretory pathway ATPase VirB11/archaellum biosynthesis ATPase
MHRSVLLYALLSLFSATAVAQQPHATVTGAIRVVNNRTRTLEVTTGVGMALRAVKLQLAADTRITAEGAALPADSLKAGDIVRISYGARPGGFVAYTIERIGRLSETEEKSP